LIAALTVILLGCAPDPREPDVDAAIPDVTEDPAGPAPGALPTEDPPFESFEGATAPIVVRTESVEPITLSDVRASSREEHDRVIFEFRGDELPGYEIGYLEGTPRDCETGRALDLAGARHLGVRFSPAGTEGEGAAALRTGDGFPVVRSGRMICDRENAVEWAIGVTETAPYRVLELEEPVRLVVDLRRAGG